jgi:predicted TIM-barrel fold metal-dependent hydrolase
VSHERAWPKPPVLAFVVSVLTLPDEEPAKHAIEDGLDDRLVFSTDFPHADSKVPYAVDRFLELDISDDAKRKILWDTCAATMAWSGKSAGSWSSLPGTSTWIAAR